MRFAILSCNIIQLIAIGTHRFSFALTHTERLLHAITCMLTALLLATAFDRYAKRSNIIYRMTAFTLILFLSAELLCIGSKAFAGGWTQRELMVVTFLSILGAVTACKKIAPRFVLNRSLTAAS